MIGLIICVFFIFIMGCTDSPNINGRTDKVILIDEWVQIHPVADVESSVFYKGIIKNVGGSKIDEVIVRVNFYDENDTFLFYEDDLIYNLKSGGEEYFSVSTSSSNPYYQDIDHVDYEFIT
jgi:hypothetical protein